MSRVDKLEESAGESSVDFLKFMRLDSKRKVIAIFEGEDEKYYGVRIRTISSIEWSGMSCGGKSKALKLREDIKNHPVYSTKCCMFFVDADFDDNSEISKYSDVYITPCYSVENLYISDNVFERILSAEFSIDRTNNYFSDIILLFKETKKTYIEAISAFNFLILELRSMEKGEESPYALNLNNITFDRLVKIDIDTANKKYTVKKNYDEKNPKAIFTKLPDTLTINTDKAKKIFKGLSGEKWFRGKQNLEFFRIFLEKLKTDRRKKENHVFFEEKGPVKLEIPQGNCISALSQYADTPKCLYSFLKKQEKKWKQIHKINNIRSLK